MQCISWSTEVIPSDLTHRLGCRQFLVCVGAAYRLERHLAMLYQLQSLFSGKWEDSNCIVLVVYFIIIIIIIVYSDQQTHNYLTNYHTATCFDTILSPSDSLQSTPCPVTPVFQMQLSVIQFTVQLFHTGFMERNM